MKNEAHYHLISFVKELGYFPKNIQLSKIKQSNKKPCYISQFDLDNCSISGVICQNDDNEWIFNVNTFLKSRTISQLEFNEKVKESELLNRQFQRFISKQKKINLSTEDIKLKDIQIKEERQFKKII